MKKAGKEKKMTTIMERKEENRNEKKK